MLAALSLAVAASLHFGVIGGPDFREALVVQQSPMSLNPLIGSEDPAVRDVAHLLYRGLLKLDATAYPRADLVESYVASSDGLTYVMALRPGQRWSSGGPITPADVAATFGFLQTSLVADKRLSTLVQGVKLTVAGADLVFTLPSPRASFPSALTQIPILPISALGPAKLAAAAAHPSRPMATSGAYRVASATAASIELDGNAYASPKPRLGHIRLDLYTTFTGAAAAFTGGGADALLATTPQDRATLLKRSGSTSHDIRTFQFVDLLFNERVPGLDDPVVRRAIGEAVNRADIQDGALESWGGVAQVDAVSRGLAWATTAPVKEPSSPVQASTDLQKDGWMVAPDGTRVRGSVQLAYTLTVPDVSPLSTVAAEVSSQLAQIGITLRVAPVAPESFVSPDVTEHDFQVALGDWDNGPDLDVSAFWRSNATPPNGFNVSGARTDPFLDQALDVLATATDPQARIAAAATVSGDLAIDAPVVFLYTPDVAYVTHGSLTSMPVPAAGDSAARFSDIAAWHH